MPDDPDHDPEMPPEAPVSCPADPLATGLAVIRAEAGRLGSGAGVYRMIDAEGRLLYVGKARDLGRRVLSYTVPTRLPLRLKRMVAETRRMEITHTASEVEALLLEANLIKRLKPRYNILLRDDKSFPYILISGDHAFPQLTKYRRPRGGFGEGRKGRYFGPFAGAGAVNRTVTALQRAFLLRNCSDTVFAGRDRPCLQYQIRRCSAPCVDHVSEADYAEQVAAAEAFLTGNSRAVQERFTEAMQAASDDLDFEQAARWRDRLRALAAIRASQDINIEGLADADVVALHQAGGTSCVQVFFFRGGRNYGNNAYFPRHEQGADAEAVLAAFLAQFYDDKPPPPLILASHVPEESDLLAEALTHRAGRKVTVTVPRRGDKRRLIERALANAGEAHGRRMAESASQRRLLEGVAALFDLDAAPERIEIYDNSHISGRHPLGAMVVAGPEGFVKAGYRTFSIKTAMAPGDDYAMLREVLTRRFSRAQKEDPERVHGQWPDLVLIDGGKGQLSTAEAVLAELGIEDLPLVAISKGPERDAGREQFHRPGHATPLTLPPNDPVLYYLQKLRDEAHRFAISGHRAKRGRAIAENPLDAVPGIGPKRKKALITHFGSGKAAARASLDDLRQVEGISDAVARKLHAHFHGD